MRIEPKTAAAYAAGAFLFLLIFGVGWPGPGTWLLVFSLLLIAAAAAAWWLDGAIVPQAGAVLAGSGATSPFGARGRPAGRGAGRSGDSLLLSLGFPGPDARGRWVLPDRVHLTALAGAVGLLAMIIFVAGALGGGGGESAATGSAAQTAPAIDFANGNGQVSPAAPATLDAATTDPATAAPLTPGGDGTGIAPAAAGAQTAPQTSPIVVETPTAPIPAPARALDAPATLPTADEAIVHEVVSGDTIYDLAITYDSSIEAILLANGLGENSTINIGDRLLIPAVETSAAAE